MWPFSTITRLRGDVRALSAALEAESFELGALKKALNAEMREHNVTRNTLESARTQREDVRVRMDNALRDIAVEQEKARKATLEVAELRQENERLVRRVNELVDKLAVAEKNDARDAATGKYVRGAKGPVELTPAAPVKAPRKRKAGLVKP